jgi:hypothetical protein
VHKYMSLSSITTCRLILMRLPNPNGRSVLEGAFAGPRLRGVMG